MMTLVPARKRKDSRNLRDASHDKSKKRVTERSGQRNSSQAGRRMSNFRKGSIRIFSILRGGKSTFTHPHPIAT
jgi:hypothetical protein